MRFALRIVGILAVSTSSHALAQTNATTAATPSPTQTQTGTPATGADALPQTVRPSVADGDVDIVVTAQRRKERLQSVPISVSVTTGPALQRFNILNLENVAARTPAVRIAVAPISDFIVIRGVGSSLNQGFEQSVATFVDGIYRGRSRSTRAALFDVERVEVLKGPQTTFFGNNAIAGAFNITTRKPGSKLEANASSFYAPNTAEYVEEAGFSVPLTSTLAFRIAGRASGQNGNIKNDITGRNASRLRDEVGRFSVRWTPVSTIETNARFDVGHFRDRDTFPIQLLNCPPPAAYGAAAGQCARYLAASGGQVDNRLDNHTAANPSYFNYDYQEAAQTTSFGFGSSSLIATTGYFHHAYDQLIDVTPVPASRGGSVVGTSQAVPLRILERYHQFSQEVRLQSDQNRPISYLVGVYYAHDRLDITTYQSFFQARLGAALPAFYTPTSPLGERVTNSQTTETKSAFAALTARPVTGLRFNAALRYSVVNKDAHRLAEGGTSGSLPSSANFVPGSAAAQAALLPLLGTDTGDFATNHRSDKRWLPAASIQYDLAKDVMAYASYTRGFKAGGFSVFANKSIFGPESVNAYEVGIKSQFLDRRLTVNLTGFWSDYKDLQETTTIPLPSGGSRAVVGNVASSRSRGIELGGSLRASGNLTLTAEFSYLDAIYTNYPNGPCTVLQTRQHPVGCTQDLSGRMRAFAPKYSGSLGIEYSHPLGDRFRLRSNLTTYFTSRFFQQPNADETLRQNGFAKLDARIAIASTNDRWELAVIGKNLTNLKTASFRQFVSTSPGSVAALQDPSRSVGGQLSFRY